MSRNPTLINRDSTPADVLAAMLPVVREAFAPPWTMLLEFAARGSDDQFTLDDDERIAVAFASHVLPPLMQVGIDGPEASPCKLMAALTAFRDAWCDAAENQTKEN